MNRILVTAALTLLVSQLSFGQGFSIGPKAGVNMGKIQGKGFDDQFTLGYHIGAFTEVYFSKKVGIQAEVLWNQINADTVSGFSNVYQISRDRFDNVQLNYLSVPLMLNYKPVKILTLQAGPQFGIRINNNQNLLQNGQEAFKNGDLSMLLGAQLNLLKLRIYGRYAVGLNNISDAPDANKWTSQAVQLGVGLAF